MTNDDQNGEQYCYRLTICSCALCSRHSGPDSLHRPTASEAKVSVIFTSNKCIFISCDHIVFITETGLYIMF